MRIQANKFLYMRCAALSLAVCLVLGLTACGRNKNSQVFQEIQARDAALMLQASMSSQVLVPSDDGFTSYVSTAEWEDADGIRHMYNARAEITGGAGTDVTESEAWSSSDQIWLSVNGSDWQVREPGTGADRPVALDLDAAVSFINRLAKLTEKADITLDRESDAEATYSFDVKFSEVRKLVGGAADDLKLDTAGVTCVFSTLTSPDGDDSVSSRLRSIQIEASDGETALFSVTIDIGVWNGLGTVLLPAEIVDPDSIFEFDIEQKEGSDSAGYAKECVIPDDMIGSELSVLADRILASGGLFDLIQVESQDDFDNLLHYSHGTIGGAYWYSVLSVEIYDSVELADTRCDELTAFNDLWYLDDVADQDDWICWGNVDDPDVDGMKLEMLKQDGGRVYLMQAACEGGVTLDSLAVFMASMLQDIGV